MSERFIHVNKPKDELENFIYEYCVTPFTIPIDDTIDRIFELCDNGWEWYLVAKGIAYFRRRIVAEVL